MKKVEWYKHIGTFVEILLWSSIVVLLATITSIMGFRGLIHTVIPIAVIAVIGLTAVTVYSLIQESIKPDENEFTANTPNQKVKIRVRVDRKGKKAILKNAEHHPE